MTVNTPRSQAVELAATFAGFLVLWLALDRGAATLGSLRGEYGIAICLAIVVLALIIESVSARRHLRAALHALGLTNTRRDAFIYALVFCAATLCFFPAFAYATGATMTIRPDAALLAIGIFAQGGIAEEVVFRGYLFRRLRETRSFWRAAAIATIPFAAVHALLFFTLDPMIAAAAFLVSLSMSFPLAWLFERSGNAIWPCALVHAVVQGAIKLVDVGEPHAMPLALAWMAIATLGPWVFFLLRPISAPARSIA
jgi:membrane protease YdiL (CAAX protease family)